MVWISRDTNENEALHEIFTQSPRAVAIVATAFLENRITDAVASQFPIAGQTKTALFAPEGHLGSLDAKSMAAYTLGLVSRSAYQDLRAIIQVRNKFAHRMEIGTFDHPEVAALCVSLSTVERHTFPRGYDEQKIPPDVTFRLFEEERDEQLRDPRRRFILTVRMMSLALFQMAGVNSARTIAKPRI